MKGITHPFSRALYEQDGAGHVRVTDTEGRIGTYAVDGRWVSGARFDIDPHLIGWVGGPKVAHHRVAVDEH